MKIFLKKNTFMKITLTTILFIILGLFIFKLYNYQQEKNKFNIIFKYGVEEEVNLLLFKYNRGPKNILNTLKDTFEKDLILKGKAKTKLALTDSEMKEIETYIIEKNIMKYTEKITYETKLDIGRIKSYLTIYLSGQKKTIVWMNLGSRKDYTEDMKNQVENLNQLEHRIVEMIEKKEEFKKLPDREGGYL